MAKKKHVVTNAMRMLTAKKIPFKAYEYEADEVGDNFGCVIAELLGTDPAKTYKTLVGKGDKTGVIVAVIPVNNEYHLEYSEKLKEKLAELNIKVDIHKDEKNYGKTYDHGCSFDIQEANINKLYDKYYIK